jgi:integrase
LNAILFLYHEVLLKNIGYVDGVIRAKKARRLPVVLTKEEVKKILGRLAGTPWLTAMLLYGAGMRVMECCRLRVKDIDFSQNEILIRADKGDKDRHTMLPASIKQPLLRHLQAVKRQHDHDLEKRLGRVALPNPWRENIPTRVRSGDGNGYFLRPAILRTG